MNPHLNSKTSQSVLPRASASRFFNLPQNAISAQRQHARHSRAAFVDDDHPHEIRPFVQAFTKERNKHNEHFIRIMQMRRPKIQTRCGVRHIPSEWLARNTTKHIATQTNDLRSSISFECFYLQSFYPVPGSPLLMIPSIPPPFEKLLVVCVASGVFFDRGREIYFVGHALKMPNGARRVADEIQRLSVSLVRDNKRQIHNTVSLPAYIHDYDTRCRVCQRTDTVRWLFTTRSQL